MKYVLGEIRWRFYENSSIVPKVLWVENDYKVIFIYKWHTEDRGKATGKFNLKRMTYYLK